MSQPKHDVFGPGCASGPLAEGFASHPGGASPRATLSPQRLKFTAASPGPPNPPNPPNGRTTSRPDDKGIVVVHHFTDDSSADTDAAQIVNNESVSTAHPRRFGAMNWYTLSTAVKPEQRTVPSCPRSSHQSDGEWSVVQRRQTRATNSAELSNVVKPARRTVPSCRTSENQNDEQCRAARGPQTRETEGDRHAKVFNQER